MPIDDEERSRLRGKAQNGTASLRFSFAGAAWPCKTGHEQYNPGDSDLKKEIPVKTRTLESFSMLP
jgi:hypothetical protein